MSLMIGFLGFGNMAQSIFNGALHDRIYDHYQWCYFDLHVNTHDRFDRHIESTSEQHFFQRANVIIVCVKPHQLSDVVRQFHQHKVSDKLVISIMAGINSEFIRKQLSGNCRVTRVMPNTPAKIKFGISAISYDPDSSPDECSIVDDLFLAIGKIVPVDDSLMNAITAISGSGPAFVYRIIEAMSSFGRDKGLSFDQAQLLVCQTFIGAAKMVLQYRDIDKLIESVSSPKGTTVAGLSVMDQIDMSQSIKSILDASLQRAQNIEEELQ